MPLAGTVTVWPLTVTVLCPFEEADEDALVLAPLTLVSTVVSASFVVLSGVVTVVLTEPSGVSTLTVCVAAIATPVPRTLVATIMPARVLGDLAERRIEATLTLIFRKLFTMRRFCTRTLPLNVNWCLPTFCFSLILGVRHSKFC